MLLAVRSLWRRLPSEFDAAWTDLGPQVLTLISAGQLAAAREASTYVPAVLSELGVAADPVAQVVSGSVVGVAASGVSLADLMPSPIIATKQAIASGASLVQAKESGGALLDGIAHSQVSDAGRTVESVEIAVRPTVTGYVRMLNLPSCSRCVILAGRFYRWSAGFKRHNRCDCRHIPASEDVASDMRTDPLAAIKAGQVRGLSKADAKAIVEDGADPNQVINAQRGMSTGQVLGQKVKLAGATKAQGAQRLRPETLYQLAGGDRLEAQRLLYRFGYLLSPPQ